MKTDFNLVKYLKGLQQLLAQVILFPSQNLQMKTEKTKQKTKTVGKERKETESERQGRTNQV